MRRGQRIDEARLRELWATGMPTKEIAHRLGCIYASVNRAANRLGLPKRMTASDRAKVSAASVDVASDAAEPTAPVGVLSGAPDDVAAAISAARGYSDLAAIADAHGLALSEVQRRWHQVRGS